MLAKVKNYSIGHDEDYIKSIKLIKTKDRTLLSVVVEDKLIFHSVTQDGGIGEMQKQFNLNGSGNIDALNYDVNQNDEICVIVTDSTYTLHVIYYDSDKVTQKENITYATFIEDSIYALEREGSILYILDSKDATNELKTEDIPVDEFCSVHYIKNKAIAIFSGEYFDLNIFDFKEEATKEDFMNFNYKSWTKFEEVFTPSDNMLDDQSAKY